MELTDLSRDVLLMVSSFLDDEAKLELLAIFPVVAEQVSTCTIQSSPDLDIDAMAQVFQKMVNVKKVVIDESGWGWNAGSPEEISTRKEILQTVAAINPRIQKFKFGLDDNPRIEHVAAYIEQVRLMDVTYDASNIDHCFVLDHGSCGTVLELLKKYPNLNLKLNKISYAKLLQKRDIGHLVTGLTLLSTTIWNFQNVAGSQVLESYPSLNKLSFVDVGGSPLDVLQSVIQRSPLLSDVELKLDVNSVAPFFDTLKTIQQLESIVFTAAKYIWTAADFESFGELLKKSTLKHVQINTFRDNHLGVIRQLLFCNRNNFKSFVVRSDLFITLSVQKKCIEALSPLHFQHISISELMSKFKNIRKIVVEVNTEMHQRVQEELKLVTSNCPKNASTPQTTLKLVQ